MSASISASEARRAPPAAQSATPRQDLRLYPGPRIGGAPSWMLYDPLRHSYFQLDANAVAVLSAWRGEGDTASLAAMLEADGTAPPGTSAGFVDFAERNELIDRGSGGWRGHARLRQARHGSPLMWLVHNYLFVKIPLWRPRHAFERASFVAAPFATRAFFRVTLIAAILGVYLVSRQWATFVGTFPSFLSLDGAVVYTLALVGTKTVHELAHAFTAARHGCRVSSMGVAFMVCVPMLYCDVTDSWRLADRRKRMAIDAAGLVAELALAVYATLAWVLLPDGPLRTGAFLVSTTSIASSLLINLNPMMRFDGYLMIADALGVPNLQTRAFALLRWTLREVLFALGAPKPDIFDPIRRRLVLAYGVTIVAYRAVVYFGIALLVYHATFKLLGILLFAIEIGWFFIAPIWKEIAMWWRLKQDIRASRRARVSACVAAAVLILLLFPFRSRIVVPAVIEPASYARVFPTSPAKILEVTVKVGDRVESGQALLTLVSPQNERDRSLARIRLGLVEAKLQRRASVAEDRAESLSLEMERKLLMERLDGLERERHELVLRSPITGIVRDLDPDLDAGRWLGRDTQVALITAPGAAVVRGYVGDGSLDGIGRGAEGSFYPDSFFIRGVRARVTEIGYAAANRLEIVALSSTAGGPIAAREMPDHGAAPDHAMFPIRFSAEVGTPRMVTRGTVLLEGARESLAGAAWRQVVRVLVRESGL